MVFRDGTKAHFFIHTPGPGIDQGILSSLGTWPIETWVTLEMFIQSDTPSAGLITVTPRIDGTALTPISTDAPDLTQLYFGSLPDPASQFNAYHHLDDLRIGTTDWGSSDIFAADFASAIIPPFTSLVPADAPDTTYNNLSIDAGTLKCVTEVDFSDGPGWAYKSLTLP